MILDTSAVLAILFNEPEAGTFTRLVIAARRRRIGAPTLVEAAAVLTARKGPGGQVALDALLQRLAVEVLPFTAQAAEHARSAYSRFGKGIGEPAVLNYGDCLAYGVARDAGEMLLCKGGDFVQTDLDLVPHDAL